jgi:hypothetical protein
MNAMTAENVEKDRILNVAPYRDSKMEPGRDAWELLQRLWMPKPDRFILPVDPFRIGSELGIGVFRDDELAPRISGILRKAPGFEDPEIFLNALDTRDRRRFTCAHALGRYSYCIETGRDDAWEFEDGRDLFAPQDRDDAARYAIEFAAELLMPRVALREFLETRGVAALAALFGVTGDAMSYRLDRIGWSRV